jgi:hypothetical protein
MGSAEEEAKEVLAKTLLNASSMLPSPDLRSRLVESLALKEYLDVEEIPVEKGELFAYLRRRDVIADDVATYERVAATDWPTREALIHVSPQFQTYVTRNHVGGDLAPLFLSAKVGRTVKLEILARADEFVEGAGRAGLIQLADFALQEKDTVSEDVVLTMARDGVPSQQIVLLLQSHLTTISRDKLFMVLSVLDGDYPKLTQVGRDKPKVPNTAGDRALLDRLKRENIVNSYDDQATPLKVNKRHK